MDRWDKLLWDDLLPHIIESIEMGDFTLFEHVTEDCQCAGRWCPGCESQVCIGRFYKSKNSKGGLAYRCKPCSKVYAHDWYVRNREETVARTQAYQEANPEKRKVYNKRYKSNHADEVREQNKQWNEQNVDRRRAYRLKYRRTYPERYRAYARKHYVKHPEKCRASNTRWRRNNRDRHLAVAREYKQKHAERLKEQTKKWHQLHVEHGRQYRHENRKRIMERNKRWRKNHPERMRTYETRKYLRRVARHTLAGGFYTVAEWEALKVRYDYTCLWCGRREPEIELTADHVIPVSKQGTSNIDNIQPLCRACNSRKRDKTIDFR